MTLMDWLEIRVGMKYNLRSETRRINTTWMPFSLVGTVSYYHSSCSNSNSNYIALNSETNVVYYLNGYQ